MDNKIQDQINTLPNGNDGFCGICFSNIFTLITEAVCFLESLISINEATAACMQL